MDNEIIDDINVKAVYMSQAESLLPWKTLLGTVELGLEMRGIPTKARQEMALHLINRVGLSEFTHS